MKVLSEKIVKRKVEEDEYIFGDIRLVYVFALKKILSEPSWDV
jgi:hypothetical protein